MLLVNRSLGISEGLLAPQSLGLVQIHIFTTIPPQLGGIYHQQLWSASSRWQPSESTLGSTGRVSSICSTIVINLLQPSPTFSILSTFSKFVQLSPRGGGLLWNAQYPCVLFPKLLVLLVRPVPLAIPVMLMHLVLHVLRVRLMVLIVQVVFALLVLFVLLVLYVLHARTAHTHYTHALHAHTTRTYYTHALHARTARTTRTHYTHALDANRIAGAISSTSTTCMPARASG